MRFQTQDRQQHQPLADGNSISWLVRFVLLMLLMLLCALPGLARSAQASDPVLEVFDGGHSLQFKRAELLNHPATRTVNIERDAAYHKAMTLRAIPIATLIPGLAQMESLQITALDGFVANLPGRLLAGAGQAWIAIEPPDQPWPALKTGSTASAGPFYLVWLTPEKAAISDEQWPYQIAKIALAAPLQQRYKQLLPTQSGKAAQRQAQRGLEVYVENCAVCHQLNGGGDANIGPDLNRPFSPTEYFQEAYLRQLIRHPASVRSWKQSVMPGFNQQSISDASLNDLIAYFKQMAKQRKK